MQQFDRNMMRKSIFLVAVACFSAIFVNTGCVNSNNPGQDSIETDSIIADTTVQDSLSEMIEETPMPVAADEIFDDFFFNFAASRKVQRERIDFPLQVDNYGKEKVVEQKNWQMEHFFMRQGFYTLIMTNAKQRQYAKDTHLNNVIVERIDMQRNFVTQWYFSRDNGLWRMKSMKNLALAKHPDGTFLSFYQKFATDSLFQQQSLYDPVTFTGPDPEDDFSTMTGELMPEQWPSFAPQLPSGVLYNIIYAEKPYPQTDTRLLYLCGIANGFQMDMMFVRQGNKWLLKKMNT